MRPAADHPGTDCSFDWQASALRTLDIELLALRQLQSSLAESLGQHLAQAGQLMLACRGRIVVSGIGKSGHIGRKIAATLASTGTPAFFMHLAEALHGDLGMLTAQDVLLAISFSGESEELLRLLPVVRRMGVPLITISRDREASLPQLADVALALGRLSEACPLGLAPTSSTTATLVLGDMLAVALLEARGFTADDFALSHPGGSLGKRLLLRVSDIMRTGDAIPVCSTTASLQQALFEMTSKGLGMTAVIDATGQLAGVFTDGDLRRALGRNLGMDSPIISVMSTHPFTIAPDRLAAELLHELQARKINGTFVIADRQLVGALNLHDLLKAGIA